MSFEDLQYHIAEGDETAFKNLFENFFPGLLSYSTSLLNDRLLAEEVVEDVFVKLWENRANVPSIQNISHYLYTAVRYASINAYEREKKHKKSFIGDPEEVFSYSFSKMEYGLISKENCQAISDAIDRLPPKCKLIFRLIKEEGMRYREVAELLNLSEKTIENQMNIAVRKLIESLRHTFPEFNLYFVSNKN